MLRTRSLIGIRSNFIHCSVSVVGRVVIADGQFDDAHEGVSVWRKLVCWEGASVVGDDVGVFVDGFFVGTELEKIVGFFVVGRRVGRGKTGLDVVGFDVGDDVS